MSYDALATAKTPALVIYLLDVSKSMAYRLGTRSRIDVVVDALKHVFEEMTSRCMKGKVLSPRYRVAVYAYNDQVHDVLKGVKTINELVDIGVPILGTERKTDTAAAFLAVEALLQREIASIRASDEAELRKNPDSRDIHPAPLVCHMTDGEFKTEDPEPIVRRIMNMSVHDGHVLVENIFISDNILAEPVGNIRSWKGITNRTRFSGLFGEKLFRMSSPMPSSYRKNLIEFGGYRLAENSVLLFPGENSDLVELGFQMSGLTGVVNSRHDEED